MATALTSAPVSPDAPAPATAATGASVGLMTRVLWTAAYFVAFWSVTGQTPGARMMQVRLVTEDGEKIKPLRAVVRWIAMTAAMVPLPWGYVPIPFQRLGFPDWLAHTRVVEVEQLSIAAARMKAFDGDVSRQVATPPARR